MRSLRQVALQAGIGQPTLQRYMTGVTDELELRTLRALGLSARGLIGLVLLELLVLALVSGAIGIGLGYLVAAALLPDVAATLRGPDTMDCIAPAAGWQAFWKSAADAKRAGAAWLQDKVAS